MRPAADAAPRRPAGARAARPAMAGGSPEADDPEQPRREGAVPARREGAEVAPAEAAGAARTHRIAPARGRVRRRAVRAGHGGVRDLPRAALRPRPRRGRGDRLAGLSALAPPAEPLRGARSAPPRVLARHVSWTRPARREIRSASRARGARRVERFGSSSRATPAAQGRPPGPPRAEGANFRPARLRMAWHRPLHTRAPPPARARSSTSGCWRSWPPRFAVAAPAAGLAGVPAQVARVVRTGVCIVGGDVCRTSDAAAAGLAPCTLSDRRRGGGLAVTILSVRIGGDHQWLVARRSDGSVAVTKVARDDLGASGGLGLRARPAEGGHRGRGRTQGRRRRRLGVPRRRDRAPLPGRRALRALGRDPALAGRLAIGRDRAGHLGLGGPRRGRHGRGRRPRSGGRPPGSRSRRSRRSAPASPRGSTTLYLRAQTEGPRTTGVLEGLLDAGPAGPVIAEYTRDGSGPRELAFRITRARRARARGRRDRRAAGPAGAGPPRRGRAAPAPPGAVAARGRGRPARGDPRRGPQRAPSSAACTRSTTARGRSSWRLAPAPRSGSRPATRRSTAGSWRRARGRPARGSACARTAWRRRSPGDRRRRPGPPGRFPRGAGTASRAAGPRARVGRPVRYPSDELTQIERERLAQHFTDLDGPVFALVNLPETVKGALFARYSRYPGTLRRLFLDEFADSLPHRAALRRRRGAPGGRALRAHLRRLRRRLGRPARRRPRGLRVDVEHPHQDPPAPAARAPTSSSPPATSPTTRRCRAAATATTATRSSARSTRPRWTRSSEPTPRRCRACAPGWTGRSRAADGEPAGRARPRGQREGVRPAARAAAGRVAEPHGHLRHGPGLRAADPAPDRPPAARGARATARASSRRSRP